MSKAVFLVFVLALLSAVFAAVQDDTFVRSVKVRCPCKCLTGSHEKLAEKVCKLSLFRYKCKVSGCIVKKYHKYVPGKQCCDGKSVTPTPSPSVTPSKSSTPTPTPNPSMTPSKSSTPTPTPSKSQVVKCPCKCVPLVFAKKQCIHKPYCKVTRCLKHRHGHKYFYQCCNY